MCEALRKACIILILEIDAAVGAASSLIIQSKIHEIMTCQTQKACDKIGTLVVVWFYNVFNGLIAIMYGTRDFSVVALFEARYGLDIFCMKKVINENDVFCGDIFNCGGDIFSLACKHACLSRTVKEGCYCCCPSRDRFK